jgi:hypothetical protein
MTATEKENTKGISATEYVRTNFRSSDRLAVLVRNRDRAARITQESTSQRRRNLGAAVSGYEF